MSRTALSYCSCLHLINKTPAGQDTKLVHSRGINLLKEHYPISSLNTYLSLGGRLQNVKIIWFKYCFVLIKLEIYISLSPLIFF